MEILVLVCLSARCVATGIDGKDPAKVGWIWDSGNRSSFDILWSCLAVVLVCTYKVVHLNLPAEREAEASWRGLDFWRKWFRKLKWMGLMAIAPEVILSMALQDWLWSNQSVRDIAQSSPKNESSTRNTQKPLADTAGCAADSQKAMANRSLPGQVPLRYAPTITSV